MFASCIPGKNRTAHLETSGTTRRKPRDLAMRLHYPTDVIDVKAPARRSATRWMNSTDGPFVKERILACFVRRRIVCLGRLEILGLLLGVGDRRNQTMAF